MRRSEMRGSLFFHRQRDTMATVDGAIMKDAWLEMRAELERERLRIQSEITSYPPPIPACDAYFNYLLARRALIADEITRVDEAAASGAPQSALDAFRRSSVLFDRNLPAAGRHEAH